MSKPVVFFGSSVEGLPILDELRSGLAHVAYHRSWDRSFPPGSQTLDALRQAAQESDFAVFLFGPDDWTESRSVAQQAPRDNVVFEAGLFGGLLGFDRVFIVHEKNVKRPSDLDGFTCIKYDRSDEARYQVEHALPEIRKVIASKGRRAGPLDGVWWQFHVGARPKVEKSSLAIMRIESAPGDLVRLAGKAWTEDGEPIARFKSLAVSVKRDPPGVFYYWEGEWPEAEGTPRLHGRGEITLKDLGRGSGWYTAESDAEGYATERFVCEYVRGTTEDLTTVDGPDREERSRLIQRKLSERPEFGI
jgi:hypothetical protein